MLSRPKDKQICIPSLRFRCEGMGHIASVPGEVYQFGLDRQTMVFKNASNIR